MISYIKGKIAKKGIDYLIIENNGIGYNINTSLNTLNKLSEGEDSSVFTYMHVREDAFLLYGFSREDELDMFKKLISVNGVGPKAALSFLSTYEVNTLKLHIFNEDVTAISKVSGVGKKTAQKVIIELKDKLGSIETISSEDNVAETVGVSDRGQNEIDDIVNVLVALGFSQNEALKVLESIDISGKTENQIIKEALKNINR